MHELGIAKDFWKIIKQTAEENKLNRIDKIVIVLGEASGIEEDFVRHSLKDHVLPGTIAEKAKLIFEKTKLEGFCGDCREKISKEKMKNLSCPNCKSLNIEIASGKEMYVKNIQGE
ncbi:MAG: hydrogenase maturation nickel metallochaperone HypA [Elusimicrobia bacterium]|nr:hydrogenase maturation nickel metallochaperone HypA [Elusimicrobiota bacterium]